MDVPLELSSRLEDRIDDGLFGEDSGDLSLPGVARRAPSLTQSLSSDARMSYSGMDESVGGASPTVHVAAPMPGVPEVSDMSVRSSRSSPRAPPANDPLAVDASTLNRRLMDDSDSLQLSMKRASLSDTASTSFDGEEQREVLDAAPAAPAVASDPLSPPSSDSSSESIPDSPSLPRSRNASMTAGERPRLNPAPASPQVPSSDESDSTDSRSFASPAHEQSAKGLSEEQEAGRMPSPRNGSSANAPELNASTSLSAHKQPRSSPGQQTGPRSSPGQNASQTPPTPASASHRSAKADVRASQTSSTPANASSPQPLADASASQTRGSLSRSGDHASRASTSRSPRSAPSPASALRSSGIDTTALEPSLDVLTVPNFASPLRGNISLPVLQTETLEEPATHVDANRLLVYQHKLNARLTSENEMLKAQCDELRRLAQRGPERHEADTSAAAAAEAAALRRQVQELQAQLGESSRAPQAGNDSMHWRMLIDMADILQGQHEQLLQEISDTSNAPRAHLLNYVERLEKALNHAHGVINSMRDYAAAHPPASAPAPAANASLSASLSRSVPPAEQSRLLEADGPDEMGAELVRMQQLVHSLADELHTARRNLDAAAQRSQEAVAAKARVEEHLAATLSELAQSKETVQGRARTLHRARERYTEASRSIDAAHSDAGELAHLEQALANAEEELAVAREEHQRIAQQRQLLDEQLGLAVKRYEDAGAASLRARESRAAAEAQLDAQLAQIEELQRALTQRNEVIARLHGDKDRLWAERAQIIEQLGVFEAHLRRVRSETEHYGEELRTLRAQRQCMQPSDTLQHLQPQLRYLRASAEHEAAARHALAFQKTYLTRAVAAHEWLCARLQERLTQLAPILYKYGGVPERASPQHRLRPAALVVLAAARFARAAQPARRLRRLHREALEAKEGLLTSL